MVSLVIFCHLIWSSFLYHLQCNDFLPAINTRRYYPGRNSTNIISLSKEIDRCFGRPLQVRGVVTRSWFSSASQHFLASSPSCRSAAGTACCRSDGAMLGAGGRPCCVDRRIEFPRYVAGWRRVAAFDLKTSVRGG